MKKQLSHAITQSNTSSNPHLTDTARKEVTDLFTLIRQHELIITALKDSVMHVVEQDAHIDLSSGGYDLNLSTGELTPKAAQEGASA